MNSRSHPSGVGRSRNYEVYQCYGSPSPWKRQPSFKNPADIIQKGTLLRACGFYQNVKYELLLHKFGEPNGLCV